MKRKINLFIIVCLMLLYIVSCSKKEYTIILDYNGIGVENTEFKVTNRGDMPKLPTPSDDWHSFEGWYATKGGVEFKVYNDKNYLVDDGKLQIKNYDIIEDTITFTAKYTLNSVNCFIEIEGNNSNFVDKTVSLKYGNTMPQLTQLSKDYSKFLGWYTMYNGKEILVHNGIDFINGYDIFDQEHYSIVNYTTKIYAKYLSDAIQVNLISNSNEFDNISRNIKYGESIGELPIPIKKNYEFIGWYTVKNNQEVLIYNSNGYLSNKNILNTNNYVISDSQIEIYAKYQLEQKQVELKLGNSENAKSMMISLNYGENITEYVKDIRIDGKLVTKWSTKINDINFENIYVGPVVEDNIVLYPAENIYYLITLDNNPIEYIYAEENEVINLKALTKDGYEFLGWKSSNGEIFKDSLLVTKELVLSPSFLKVGTQNVTIRNQGYSDPYIYTPKGVDGNPDKRDWEDKVTLSSYFDIQGLKDNGYKGFTITYSCEMKVIDDGYQHIYVYNSSQLSDTYLLYEKKYDSSEGTNTVSFTVEVTFSQLVNNIISFRYAASGFFNELFYSHGNQWNNSKVVVSITPYK